MGAKRSIEVDKKNAKEVQKLLKKAKNDTERRRINVIVAYLNGMTTTQIMEGGIGGHTVINTAINKYKQDPDTFYKSSRPGKKISKEWQEIYDLIKKIIEEVDIKGEIIDIEELRRKYNSRRGKLKKLSYKQAWDIVRTRLKYNYQKPYIIDRRKKEGGEEELKTNLKETIEKIAKIEGEENFEIKKQKGRIII